MKTVITVKTVPESRDELINVYADICRKTKERWEAGIAAGAFGPPEKVELRFVVEGGARFNPPA